MSSGFSPGGGADALCLGCSADCVGAGRVRAADGGPVPQVWRAVAAGGEVYPRVEHHRSAAGGDCGLELPLFLLYDALGAAAWAGSGLGSACSSVGRWSRLWPIRSRVMLALVQSAVILFRPTSAGRRGICVDNFRRSRNDGGSIVGQINDVRASAAHRCAYARPWRQARHSQRLAHCIGGFGASAWRATAFRDLVLYCACPADAASAQECCCCSRRVLASLATRQLVLMPARHRGRDGIGANDSGAGSRADPADGPVPAGCGVSRMRRRACRYVDRCRTVDRQGSAQTRSCPGLRGIGGGNGVGEIRW